MFFCCGVHKFHGLNRHQLTYLGPTSFIFSKIPCFRVSGGHFHPFFWGVDLFRKPLSSQCHSSAQFLACEILDHGSSFKKRIVHLYKTGGGRNKRWAWGFWKVFIRSEVCFSIQNGCNLQTSRNQQTLQNHVKTLMKPNNHCVLLLSS